MRILSIDIGTNSVRYLVCDIDEGGIITIVSCGGEITRLGQNLHSAGVLDKSAVDRTAKAIKIAVLKGRELQAEKIILAATSAARDAGNSKSFFNRVKKDTGIMPEILSGRQEAEVIFSGVTHEIPESPKELLILDIGGGSTECIYHDSGSKVMLNSIDIGAVRMTERFIRSDPPERNELAEMHSFIQDQFRNSITLTKRPGTQCIGVGGTITTLAAVLLEMKEYDSSKIHGYSLTGEAIRRVLKQLSTISLGERKEVAGLSAKRADIIIAGTVILNAFLDFSGFNSLTVSDRGILFGLAIKASRR